MKFEDLKFKPHPLGGSMVKHMFPNGYGISVIRTPFSYGNSNGFFEVGMLKKDDSGNYLCYDIWPDVIGYLTEGEVEKRLKEVESLEPSSG